MWQPTHVKVTVREAKGLLTKGKNQTNDAFVVIGIGKEKYQTSVKEKATPFVEWKEECELAIPSQGNKASIQLTIYHHNTIGIDEFLGQVALPLADFDVYEKPKYQSYKLQGKSDNKKKAGKERGDLEVMVHFTVKSGSFLDISKKEKHKSSLSSLKHFGGSLMSVGKEKKSLKNFAHSVSSKMDKITKPKKKKNRSTTEEPNLSNNLMASQQSFGAADPGVISDDDDDFRFDEDIKVYSGIPSSSPHSTMSRGSSLMQDQTLEPDFDVGSCDEGLSFGLSPPRVIVTGSTENISIDGSRTSLNSKASSNGIQEIKRDDSFTRLPEVKALTLERQNETVGENRKQKRAKGISAFKQKLLGNKSENRERLTAESRIVEGGNDRVPGPPTRSSKLPQEIHDKFTGKSREDLLVTILGLQSTLAKQAKHSHDLEDYIDNLLLRVLDVNPSILQAPIGKKNKPIRF